MQTWNEVLSWLHVAVKSCLMTKKVDDSLISCSEFLTLGVFPQTAVSLFKMLTIHFFFFDNDHFWDTTLGPKYLQSSRFKRFPSLREKSCLFFLRCALWSWREMKTNELNKREQLIHCCEPPPRLFTCLSEALIAILSLAISFAACLPRSCCGHKRCCFTEKEKVMRLCCDLLPRVYFLVHNLDRRHKKKSQQCNLTPPSNQYNGIMPVDKCVLIGFTGLTASIPPTVMTVV